MTGELYDVKWTKQNRLKNLISSLERMHDQDVRYGFFEESGQHPESPHLNYPTLAAIHELQVEGSRQSPRRPILEISAARNRQELQKFSLQQTGLYIERAAMLKRESPGGFLKLIGKKGVALTKPIFGNSSLLTPNTAATTKAKGFNMPMVEYGALKEALSSKVSTSGEVS